MKELNPEVNYLTDAFITLPWYSLYIPWKSLDLDVMEARLPQRGTRGHRNHVKIHRTCPDLQFLLTSVQQLIAIEN